MKEKETDYSNAVVSILSNSIFSTAFKSLIVLANPKTVLNDKFAKKEVKSQVYRADQLINVIKKANQESNFPKSSLKEMKEIANSWLSRCDEHPDARIDYFKQLIQSNAPVPQSDEKICPKCGKPLVKRVAKRGKNIGSSFWGCSGFPHCHYIEQIENESN